MISVVTEYKDGKSAREETYHGCVLCTREQSLGGDLDFYAVVWDEESQSIKSICYATERAYTYDNYAKVDATPEVLAKARAHLYNGIKATLIGQALMATLVPDIGKRVDCHSTGV